MVDTPPDGCTRWALLIEYDGTGLVGWQRQRQGISVQQCLEEAAARLCDGAKVASATAGRTDAGVHASAMVVQLDLPSNVKRSEAQLRDGINYHLKPHLIGVLSACRAPEGWHARFSAIGRRYRYTILNRPTRPILNARHAWHVRHPLDCEKMQKAADHLKGQHDFSSFRAIACQAESPIRTLEEITVSQKGERVFIDVQARSFLHHQVRNFAGSLALVGRGKWAPDRVRDVLEARDRTVAGPTAPPEGLCLIGVIYPRALF